ncbi:flagellar basal body-associated FliL family protein [Parvularcula sp. LCG005]|uniref:flagellar basal body-associated FliL family protein n=1 Tax=Parvularcula sp. LCG005 TaxID=3078805 RepID=UPI002942665D|nr:flagellar basal body-associated FliL family protein [Parvularcula sp. LCG005]WOI52687.1 flagellar basal body-associated FliL family protein [Parvularcula sp. LCG005]
MKKILPILVLLIAISGAGFAAMTLRGGSSDAAPEAAATKGSVAEVSGEGDDGHGGGEGGGDTVAYFGFQRNFIVPVMRNDEVGSLVMISLQIEINDAAEIDRMRAREPRLRDTFMMTLMGLSHDGYFAGDITEPEVYSEIRNRLNETSHALLEDKGGDVLIVDFARQDQ